MCLSLSLYPNIQLAAVYQNGEEDQLLIDGLYFSKCLSFFLFVNAHGRQKFRDQKLLNLCKEALFLFEEQSNICKPRQITYWLSYLSVQKKAESDFFFKIAEIFRTHHFPP